MEAKILILDIENAPNLVWSWTEWSGRSWRALGVVKPWYILCVGYKWLGEDAHVTSLPDFKASYKRSRRDERQMLALVWHLLDESDIVIGWNSTSFDVKKLNAKFLKYGFDPPSPFRQIDVMREKKKLALSNSNKLDDTSEEWGTGRKLKHEGFALWEKCMKGDADAWAIMTEYCQIDVEICERNYLKLRPWMATHPNLNVYSGQLMACPVCQRADTMEARDWVAVGNTRERRRYLCVKSKGGCGKWSKGRFRPLVPNSKHLIR